MDFKIGKLYKKYELVIMFHKQTSDEFIAGTIVNENDLYCIGYYGSNWNIDGWEEVVERKTEYTREEIEKEVEIRVRFKMNDLLSSIKNQATLNWNSAFNSMSQKHSNYWEAFNEMGKMFNKELEISFPYEFNEFRERENSEKLDKVIEEIEERFKLRGKFPTHITRNFLHRKLENLLK